MHEKEKELAGMLAKNCRSVNNVQELLKSIFKGTLEEMLELEMDEHLGYEKHSFEGNKSGNSRIGRNQFKKSTDCSII